MREAVRDECAGYVMRRGGRAVTLGPAARPADNEAPARGRGGGAWGGMERAGSPG